VVSGGVDNHCPSVGKREESEGWIARVPIDGSKVMKPDQRHDTEREIERSLSEHGGPSVYRKDAWRRTAVPLSDAEKLAFRQRFYEPARSNLAVDRPSAYNPSSPPPCCFPVMVSALPS